MLLKLIIIAALFFAGCNKFDEPAAENDVPETPNITIGDLHSLLNGRTLDIEDEVIIGGYVTSSDRAGNFYKSFIIEDATGGAEIMAGLNDLHNTYPKGCYITISLKGCAVGEHYGVMQVGLHAADYSTYPTDYFASRVIADKHIRRYNITRNIAPRPLNVSQLQKDMCGTLVSLGPLTHSTELSAHLWDGNQEGKWQGYNIFEDSSHNQIAVYTSDYADYASDKIPSAKVSITGILQYGKIEGKEYFMIKMRDEKDCAHIN